MPSLAASIETEVEYAKRHPINDADLKDDLVAIHKGATETRPIVFTAPQGFPEKMSLIITRHFNLTPQGRYRYWHVSFRRMSGLVVEDEIARDILFLIGEHIGILRWTESQPTGSMVRHFESAYW